MLVTLTILTLCVALAAWGEARDRGEARLFREVETERKLTEAVRRGVYVGPR